MTVRNPQLYLSDPLYETTLRPPTLEKASFFYLGYNSDEMVSDQGTASFDSQDDPVYRYAQIRWDYPLPIDEVIGGEPLPRERAGSFSPDQRSQVMNAEFFNFNRSLQLILEDTEPEVRFDPQRFIVDIESSGPANPIKSQFKDALKARFDSLDDDPDNVELFSAYIDSLKEILGSDRVGDTFDDIVDYLRDASENNTEETVTGDARETVNESPRAAFKFKMSLSTKYAPSVAASGIASTGPFALELSNMLFNIKRKKAQFSDAGTDGTAFAVDITRETTKEQIYDSFTRMNPTIDNVIRNISLLLTGDVIDPSDSDPSDEDDRVREAYNELFSGEVVNVSTSETENVLGEIAEELGNSMFNEISSVVSDLVKPVGYRINKRELRPSLTGDNKVEAINSRRIYVYDSKIKRAKDIALRYGSVYDFSVSTIYELTIPFIGQTGELFSKKVLVASEASNAIRLVAEDFTPIDPPSGLVIDRVIDDKGTPRGINLFWDHPADIKSKIRGFRVYRRDDLQKPFKLLRELQFRRPPVSHQIFYDLEVADARSVSPNGPLVDFTDSADAPAFPRRNFTDSFFLNNKQFIYCVTAVDMHGNESPCSDQITLDFDDGHQLVCLRGCPLDYPNLYIDRRLILDSAISNSIPRGRGKAVIFLDPVASRISGDLGYQGQSFTTGNKTSSFTGAAGEASLRSNLNVFDAPVQPYSGRNVEGIEDGTDAFMFTAEGGVVFDGISGEYDFIVFDEENMDTAIVRTIVEYGTSEDEDGALTARFIDD